LEETSQNLEVNLEEISKTLKVELKETTENLEVNLEKIKMCPFLPYNDHSKHEASAILEMFNNTFRTIHGLDRTCYLLHLMGAAVDQNRSDLVTLLLAHSTCRLDMCVKLCVRRPLILAMHNQNISLVEMFLRAGSSLSLKSPYMARNRNNSKWAKLVSPIEYAYLLNQRDMFRLIMSYYQNPNSKRYAFGI